ncbi:DUF1566 domain-containing protein [Moraxella nasicaprae]|uniref:DUF1566 domain-containing protein n=1 Tax=Moraxella nasicaprae TaxID=2904122 RepID=A0ABY6F1P5_9GAMM|nr:DUF1566 domain-containing protein [Moraxella nasicaprae]UXZ04018.1 DUF1566 domain-containing protein [Moraxella nasicaprae]
MGVGVSQYIKQLDDKIERSHKGLYYDESTGLMWYVCAVGINWSDKRKYENGSYGDIIGCHGSRSIYLNAEDTERYIAEFINSKNFGGYSDWRLPTVFEVESLRLANCSSWRQEQTGDTLTETGRQPTYKTATRTTLDNQGRLIIVDDCQYDKRTVFDRAFGGDYQKYDRDMYSSYNVYSVRVKESILSKNYQQMIDIKDDYGVRLTGLRLYKSDISFSDDRPAAFYIVRQHTPAKEATK